MKIRGITFERFWINVKRRQVCRVVNTYKSKAFDVAILVEPVEGMGEYKGFNGMIPIPLESFLNNFTPLLGEDPLEI